MCSAFLGSGLLGIDKAPDAHSHLPQPRRSSIVSAADSPMQLMGDATAVRTILSGNQSFSEPWMGADHADMARHGGVGGMSAGRLPEWGRSNPGRAILGSLNIPISGEFYHMVTAQESPGWRTQPLTRPPGTLSPSDGERHGVKGPPAGCTVTGGDEPVGLIRGHSFGAPRRDDCGSECFGTGRSGPGTKTRPRDASPA